MQKPKLYTSKTWLRNEYYVKKRTIQDIADSCGVSYNTIKTALRKNGLIK